MAAGVFTVRELRRFGSAGAAADPGGDGEVFVWTSDDAALVDSNGGVRCAPIGIWNLGVKLNTKKTKYPGAVLSSEQVLSGEHKDHVFQGLFQDKYNYRGFCVAEMRRFEAMVLRGNRVQVSFQEQSFEGLIVDADFPYRGSFEIGYRFTVSVHGRLDDDVVATLEALQPRTPKQTTDPTEALTRTDVALQSLLEANDLAPRQTLLGEVADDVQDKLAALAGARDDLAATLDQAQAGGVASVDQWRRIGSLFREIKRSATELADETTALRTDTALGLQSVRGFFDLEDWTRTTRYFARALMGTAEQAARDSEAKSKARTLRTYRPQAGESLMQIARRYYGTPFAWRFIADRNNLASPILVGTEVLVIPERAE